MTVNTALATDKEEWKKRYHCEAKVRWSYFKKGEFYDAKILNCSPNGNYFETPHKIKPGSTILIRLETLLSKIMRFDGPLCLRAVSLAEIKWCKDSSKDGKSYFGVGVRHLDLK